MGECVRINVSELYDSALKDHCSERNLQRIFPSAITSFEGSQISLRMILLSPLILVSLVGLCFFFQNSSKTILRQTKYRYNIIWLFFIGVVFVSGFMQIFDLFEIIQETNCNINSIETCTCHTNNTIENHNLSHDLFAETRRFANNLVSWKYTGFILYITLTLWACSGYYYYPHKWYISFVFFVVISTCFAIAADVTANICKVTVPDTLDECFTQNATVTGTGSGNICKKCTDVIGKIEKNLCSLPFNVLSVSYSIFALVCVLYMRTRDKKCKLSHKTQKNNVIDPLHDVAMHDVSWQDDSNQCANTRFRW